MYIPAGISREATSDVLVIIIGKVGKVPEYEQRASKLHTLKMGDGGGASNCSLPVKNAGK